MTQAASPRIRGRDLITYLGDPAGFVIEAENGTKLYFAGDTDVFGDMEPIGRLYEPDVAILPIGRSSSAIFEAGCRGSSCSTPRLHPAPLRDLPRTDRDPDELRALAPDVEVISLDPGETIEL